MVGAGTGPRAEVSRRRRLAQHLAGTGEHLWHVSHACLLPAVALDALLVVPVIQRYTDGHRLPTVEQGEESAPICLLAAGRPEFAVRAVQGGVGQPVALPVDAVHAPEHRLADPLRVVRCGGNPHRPVLDQLFEQVPMLSEAFRAMASAVWA